MIITSSYLLAFIPLQPEVHSGCSLVTFLCDRAGACLRLCNAGSVLGNGSFELLGQPGPKMEMMALRVEGKPDVIQSFANSPKPVLEFDSGNKGREGPAVEFVVDFTTDFGKSGKANVRDRFGKARRLLRLDASGRVSVVGDFVRDYPRIFHGLGGQVGTGSSIVRRTLDQ